MKILIKYSLISYQETEDLEDYINDESITFEELPIKEQQEITDLLIQKAIDDNMINIEVSTLDE